MSKPVEPGVGADPYGALVIDEHLPYGSGAESLAVGETFTGSAFCSLRRGPPVDMIEAPQASVADRPHGTVGGKGKVSELNIFFFPLGGRRGQNTRGQDTRSSFVGHPAETL